MAEQAAFNRAVRRKLRGAVAEAPARGAERTWPLALARAARDRLTLGLEVTTLTVARHSLAELLELVPERAMIAVLEGPAEGLGVMAVSAGLLAGLVEVQTMGRVSSGPVLARRPTRTDAAMVSDWIDTALRGLEAGLAADADLPWADGFRYASFLDDPRPLGLLLDDVPYRLMTAEISLASGAKTGPLHLALPATGRGRRPQGPGAPEAEAQARIDFARRLTEEAMAAECVLETVIARLTLPLSRILSLEAGMVLPVPAASVDRIAVVAPDGRPLAQGRLGQHRGQRAVRLTALAPGAQGQAVPVPESRPDGGEAPSLRAAG